MLFEMLTGRHLFEGETVMLPLDGRREARRWLQTPANETNGRLSPDGRWMSYVSDESGVNEVYVQPFPGPGGKWRVSQGGGFNVIWSREGRQLFYRRADQIVKVDVDTSAGFSVGESVTLFSGRYRTSYRDFDVSPDGTRFVMMRNDDPRTTELFFVSNRPGWVGNFDLYMITRE